MSIPNIHYDVTTVNDSTPRMAVGTEVRALVGSRYVTCRYVQLTAASVAGAAGAVTSKVAADGSTVTCDLTSGDGITGTPCGGILLCTVTAGNYCFALVRGYYATVTTNGDDDIAAGDILIVGAADKACDSVSNAAAAFNKDAFVKAFGVAAAADVDADNTVAANIGMPFAI